MLADRFPSDFASFVSTFVSGALLITPVSCSICERGTLISGILLHNFNNIIHRASRVKHVNCRRSCRALTWISVLTFTVGIIVQFCRRPSSESTFLSTCVGVEVEPSDALHETIANNNSNSNSDKVRGVDVYDTSETSMFTPPRPGLGSASRIRHGQAVVYGGTDKYISNLTLAHGYVVSDGHHDEADFDGEQEDEKSKAQTPERRCLRSIGHQQNSSPSRNGWKEAFTSAKS